LISEGFGGCSDGHRRLLQVGAGHESPKRDFYNPNVLPIFDAHYTKKTP